MKNNIINTNNIWNQYYNYIEKLMNNFYNKNKLDFNLTVAELNDFSESLLLSDSKIDYINALKHYQYKFYNDSKITNLIINYESETAVCNLELEFETSRHLAKFFKILYTAELDKIFITKNWKVYLDCTDCPTDLKEYSNSKHILILKLNLTKSIKGDLNIC